MKNAMASIMLVLAALLCGATLASDANQPTKESITAEIAALKDKFAREGRALGHADEFGNFNLTEEGKKIEALEKQLRLLGGGIGAQASEAAVKDPDQCGFGVTGIWTGVRSSVF